MRLSPRSLLGKLILLLASTILLSIATSWLMLTHDMKKQMDDLVVTNLAVSARVLGEILRGGEEAMNDAWLSHWSGLLGVRITLLDGKGAVLADSEVGREGIDRLDNHAGRPEIRRALEEGFGVDRRYSESTRTPYLYYALRSDAPWGETRNIIIRCSLPMSRFYAIMSRVRGIVLSALFASGIVGLLAGIYGLGRVTHPLRRLTRAARLGGTSSNVRYPTGGSLEIDELSRALRDGSERMGRVMHELESERDQLDTIVRNAPCGLMLMRRDGTVAAANEVFSPLLREPCEKVVGTRLDGAVRAPELLDLALSARSTESGLCGEASFPFRSAETTRHYKARTVPAGGDVLILLDDETERRIDEEMRKTFVADAGHELQTPLASISVAAELLSDMDGSTAGERMPYIAEIMRQRERMTRLVDDLLLLSRLESGVPSSEPETFDIGQIVRETLEEFQKSHAAAHIAWRIDLAESLALRGRRDEIRRAIANLLDNAVKYTKKRYGGEKGGEISVELKKNGGDVVFSVTDNGVGIPGPAIARVFERFERVERDRARGAGDAGGYGLGLSIVRRVVESHAGTVAAASGDGVTQFVVTLPLRA